MVNPLQHNASHSLKVNMIKIIFLSSFPKPHLSYDFCRVKTSKFVAIKKKKKCNFDNQTKPVFTCKLPSLCLPSLRSPTIPLSHQILWDTVNYEVECYSDVHPK